MAGPMLFFDLDGCLVDSRVAITRSLNDALDALGRPRRDATQLERYIGPPLRTAFVELVGDDHAEAGVAAYRRVYRRRMLTDTVVVPGMADVLAALAERATLLVVTSKPQVFAEPILDALSLAGFFTAVIGPSLDALEETKTQTLARAIHRCGGPQALGVAWMIGDRHHDVEAGRRNALRTAAVTWGIGDHAELLAASPDVIAQSPAELSALLP